jgi:hypothetical protein
VSELPWPLEQARATDNVQRWAQPRSNICLDFHGDPLTAGAVVFSDGNHHMALAETLQRFCARHPDVRDVFFATTPPGVLLQALESGGLSLGNLVIAARPHVFISPPAILDRLVAQGHVSGHVRFMRSRGNVLLVRAGNPRAINSVRDLARPEIRVFLSNPQTEAASYQVYADTLARFADKLGVALDFLTSSTAAASRIVFGERIHHREAPQALYDGCADVAVLYYHLALRYTRVFPGCFEIVALDGGGSGEPAPCAENVTTEYRVGRVGDGGRWGAALLEFLASAEVSAIYERHGLSRSAA